MLKSVRFWIAVILAVILTGCLLSRLRRKPLPSAEDSVSIQTVLTTAATRTDATDKTSAADTKAQTDTETTTAAVYRDTAAEPYLSASKMQDMQSRVKELAASCADFVGWLYVADSEIDYAVVQGKDNQYYLHHSPDGKNYVRGTIFLDYRCDRHFADSTNILFGHNMVSGMFGDLRSYRNQEAFDAHRYGWFLTAEQLYRIDFFALSLLSGYDSIYDVPCDAEPWRSKLLETALFSRETEYDAANKYILLSTCAGDFEDARLTFTGKLTEISAADAVLP